MSEADPGIFDSGGSKLWFRKDCWTLLRQITSPPHTPYPHSPSHAVARYKSLPAYRLLRILLVKDVPLEHPPLVFGYKDCTDFVDINVKVMM